MVQGIRCVYLARDKHVVRRTIIGVAETDILYLNIAGMDVIVLDSSKVATDLLETRSSLYSGRFVIPPFD